MVLPPRSIVDRRLSAIIEERLTEEPAIGLQGARSVGKSTLLRAVADRAGTPVIDLVDLVDLAQRAAVVSDPMLFARGPRPVCIDEFQHVPEILDAIKAELTVRLEPGRFMLTGSRSAVMAQSRVLRSQRSRLLSCVTAVDHQRRPRRVRRPR